MKHTCTALVVALSVVTLIVVAVGHTLHVFTWGEIATITGILIGLLIVQLTREGD